MAGIPAPPLIREGDPQAPFLVTQYLQALNRMARSLTFLDSDGAVGTGRRCLNIDAVWVNYVSNAVADTEDTVAHNLGRTPVGIFVSAPDKSAVIYRGSTAWDATNVYLKSTAVTTTADILVF